MPGDWKRTYNHSFTEPVQSLTFQALVLTQKSVVPTLIREPLSFATDGEHYRKPQPMETQTVGALS